MHPVRVAFGKQAVGLVDQIVVVEEAATILLIGVAPDDLNRDGDERRRPVAAGDAVAALDKLRHTALFGAEPFGEFRIAIGESARNQPLSRLVVLSQEDAEKTLDPRFTRGHYRLR